MSDYKMPRSKIPVSRVASPMTSYANSLECPDCGHSFELTTEGQTWRINGPADVADRLMARYGKLEQENLVVLSLSTKNQVQDETVVYVGNVASIGVRIGELFCEPIRHRAASILIVHNHPSGDPTPSPQDVALTANVLAAARILDIDLLDHIVLGADRWVSLRDQGLQFDRPTR